jgi:hypothetical protein
VYRQHDLSDCVYLIKEGEVKLDWRDGGRPPFSWTPPEAETVNIFDDEAEECMPPQPTRARTKIGIPKSPPKSIRFAKSMEANNLAQMATKFANVAQMAVKEEELGAAMLKNSAVEHIVLRPFASLNGLTLLINPALPLLPLAANTSTL